jgi:two-component sensor histidine kinase
LQARHPKARQAHLDMAERYENRVRDMTAHHEQLYVPLIEAS